MLAVDAGQHHVDQEDLRPRRLREREGVEARRGRVNREPEVLEDESDRVAQVVVVVGHEDAARQSPPRFRGFSVRRPRGRHGSVSALAAPRERWRAEA